MVLLHAHGIGGTWAGVDLGHLPGLYMLVPTAATVLLLPAAMHAWAVEGNPLAVRWMEGYRRAPATTKLAAILILITGAVHLGLFPGWLSDAPVTGLLFLGDGIALCGLAAACFTWKRWRLAAGGLLAANIVGYIVYLAAGLEVKDDLGTATKLVELTALALVLLPSMERGQAGRIGPWVGAAVAVTALTGCTGASTWVAFRVHNQHQAALGCEGVPMAEGIAEVMQPVPCTASSAEREAAAKLAADTRAATAGYLDVKAAEADGYSATASLTTPLVHYQNARFKGLHHILDPDHPEALVYTQTRSHGMVLLGALYVMPKAGQSGPDIGGPLTPWHYHQDLCASRAPALQTEMTPFGGCPPTAWYYTTPAQIHVWVIDNPIGPFGDLDARWLARLRAS
jgi:hypothetical protein